LRERRKHGKTCKMIQKEGKRRGTGGGLGKTSHNNNGEMRPNEKESVSRQAKHTLLLQGKEEKRGGWRLIKRCEKENSAAHWTITALP